MKIIEKNNFGFMETSTFDFVDKNLTHSSNKVKDKSAFLLIDTCHRLAVYFLPDCQYESRTQRRENLVRKDDRALKESHRHFPGDGRCLACFGNLYCYWSLGRGALHYQPPGRLLCRNAILMARRGG
jgi:hypothetical protein